MLEPLQAVDESEEDADAGHVRKLTKKQQAEWLRRCVDTVGRPGREGERIQNVISVGMLSEGWDAKTVTHIMGLRAFTSQLLCEQVVGRGLRRTSYDLRPNSRLLEAEHVNIFGVPFTFLPHEGGADGPPQPPTPKTAIEPVADKAAFEISWPNVIRIDHTFRPRLSLDSQRLIPLELDAGRTARIAQLAPIVEGKPDATKIEAIDLENLAREFRTQRIIFETAREVYDQMQANWRGGRASLLAQLVRLVEQFIRSDTIRITPALFVRDALTRRLIITLNMTKVVQHIREAIRFENTESLQPVFDRDRPIRSTSGMGTWYTGKPCERTTRSHINYCVYDSTWEASDAFALDHAPEVTAVGEKRSPRLRGVLRPSRRGAEISSGFSHPAHVGCHVGIGNQGSGHRSRPNQAPVPPGMGHRHQRPWRLRPLGPRRVHAPRRHPGHPGATFGRDRHRQS